jgi:putative transposase
VTDMTSDQQLEQMDTASSSAMAPSDVEVARHLMDRARAEGVSLVGPGGLLSGLTKTVLETALEAEMTEHVGYEPHDRAGHHSGNSRNGTRTKTVVTDIGPVDVDVPRDRNGTFEPKIVRKRQRRLTGVDDLVVSLVAKGLTTGEVQAHLGEVYGAEVSRDTISRITDRVLETMADWQHRPLDRVYPVMFIDAIVRHEAPHVRGEVGDLPRRVVAAARPKLRAA